MNRAAPVILNLLTSLCLALLAASCISWPDRGRHLFPNPDQDRPDSHTARLIVQVDLDYVYDEDPDQEEQNISALVRRLTDLGICTVALQAFADPDGDDTAASLYFSNRVMPVRRELFPRTARALQRAGIEVWAWMPLLAFQVPGSDPDLFVQSARPDDLTKSIAGNRLSPFHPKARRLIRAIYTDLARSTAIDGILFHDDGRLSDFEDVSPAARNALKKAGFPSDISSIRSQSRLMRRWTVFKTKALIDLSLEMVRLVRTRQPTVLSARNLYARTVLEPESEQWLAQSLPLFLQAYDYVLLMAMPALEQAEQPKAWLATLAEQALARTLDTDRLVFELQTRDWRRGRPISTPVLLAQLDLLTRQGATSLAWYPDDFPADHPRSSLIGPWCRRWLKAQEEEAP